MDEEEYKRKFEEYREKIKGKKDRELLESIALKLKWVELDIEQIREDLVDTHNLIIDNKVSFMGNEDEDNEDEDNEEEEEQEDKWEERKRNEEEQEERIKKLESHQKSFCKDCGSKLPKGFLGGYGRCENPKCKRNSFITHT